MGGRGARCALCSMIANAANLAAAGRIHGCGCRVRWMVKGCVVDLCNGCMYGKRAWCAASRVITSADNLQERGVFMRAAHNMTHMLYWVGKVDHAVPRMVEYGISRLEHIHTVYT